jgi:hypothetical protein
MIAGIGFAMMAWKLAQLRTYDQTLRAGYVRDIGPWPRDMLNPNHHGPSLEYYRIIDRAYGFRHLHPRDYGITVKL